MLTSFSYLQYLGIIEQRTNELLQVQAFHVAKVNIQLFGLNGRDFENTFD